MFFVDQPFLSDFFKETLTSHHILVVDTPRAREMELHPSTTFISTEQARQAVLSGSVRPYSNSENCLEWIGEQLPESSLHQTIRSFKDKAQFRRVLSELYPRFFFREFELGELAAVKVSNFPKRVVLKPTVGFFSLGVYVITSQTEWNEAVQSIFKNRAELETLYPADVVEWGSFIVEQYIEGDEFALDAYYDESGEAHVMGILHHHFASAEDVSDRIYCTSKKIVADHLVAFRNFVQEVGTRLQVKNFPVHVELRCQADGTLMPIEFNPMRFGGWCTTADLTATAFGCNPYVAYHLNQPPNWDELLASKGDEIHSMIILDNSTGWESGEISAFDYDALLKEFDQPLELRKIDVKQFPLFGFLFTETKADRTAELDRILHDDLRRFVTRDAVYGG